MKKDGMMSIYPLDELVPTFTGATNAQTGNTVESIGMPIGHVSLKEAWDRFSIVCLPKDASFVQLQESRRVFYGAIGWIMHSLATNGESSEADEAWIGTLEDELTEFAKDMARGLV